MLGRWLTHGDPVLEAQVDFAASVEQGLIPARVFSEWSRLQGRGLATIGRLLPRNPLMLVMLVMGLLA